MEFPPDMKTAVKPDGTIQGTAMAPYMAPFTGTKTMTWNLTPQRQ